MPLWQPMQLFRNKRADAARAARHVLANAIRRPGDVHDVLQVIAQMIQHREAEHRPVGAVDEEGAGGAARGHHARGRGRRNALERRLGAGHQVRAQIDLLASSASYMALFEAEYAGSPDLPSPVYTRSALSKVLKGTLSRTMPITVAV